MTELPVIELAGSPRHMGEAFGEICRQEIPELYALRLQAAIRFAAAKGRTVREEQVLDLSGECVRITEAYDPVGYEEFAGIARAAEISPARLYALQGLTDLRDVLGFGAAPAGVGCSSFVVAPDRSATGHLLLGQTWDLMTDNMPYVRLLRRRPDNAPETWAVTLVGCLSLIGINAAGVAVGNTNLQTTDARPGVQYLTVLHRALRCASLAEAVACIRDAPRAGAHYYYAAAGNTACGTECSALRSIPFWIERGTFVHCNHALSPEIAAVEAPQAGVSSHHRQERLGELLATHDGPIGIEDLKRILADHEGGPDRCICRHDFAGVSTNATVILCPATREIHACRGQAHVGEWTCRTAGA